VPRLHFDLKLRHQQIAAHRIHSGRNPSPNGAAPGQALPFTTKLRPSPTWRMPLGLGSAFDAVMLFIFLSVLRDLSLFSA
jgi:hypothetical protein